MQIQPSALQCEDAASLVSLTQSGGSVSNSHTTLLKLINTCWLSQTWLPVTLLGSWLLGFVVFAHKHTIKQKPARRSIPIKQQITGTEATLLLQPHALCSSKHYPRQQKQKREQKLKKEVSSLSTAPLTPVAKIVNSTSQPDVSPSGNAAAMLFTCVYEGYHESKQHQEEGPADFVAVNHGDRETGEDSPGTHPAATFKTEGGGGGECRREVDVKTEGGMGGWP